MINLSEFDRKLVNLVDGKNIKVDNSEIEKILELSKYNKIYASLPQNIKGISGWSPESTAEFERLNNISRSNIILQRKTLRGLKKVLGKKNIPFLVAKTKRSVYYVTFDIDIIVKPDNFQKAINAFAGSGYKIEKHGTINGINAKWQRTAQKEGELLIDIHQNISWLGSQYISIGDIWKDTAVASVSGVKCPVPSLTSELLLVAANVLFEKFHLTLLDYLYLSTLFKKADLLRAEAITKKYGWQDKFKLLHGEICGIVADGVGDSAAIPLFNPTLNFPLVFNFKSLIDIFINRIKSGYGFSGVAVLYALYMFIKMFLFQEKYYPYYYPVE